MMMMRQQLLFLWTIWSSVMLISCTGYYWHAYDPEKSVGEDPNCQKFEHFSGDTQQLVDKYHLWPNVTRKFAFHPDEPTNIPDNYTLYGMKYAMDYIWEHQHPKSCEGKRFVINGIHNGGFGSELHVLGAVLGVALDMDRIYLQNPIVHSGVAWEFENPFCYKSGKKNLECYYRNYSTCSVFDALGPNAINILHQAVNNVKANQPFNHELYVTTIPSEWTGLPDKLAEIYRKAENFKVVLIRNPGWLKFGVLPQLFMPLLQCSPMKPDFFYYWWRAISMMFIMRPNDEALEWMRENQLAVLDQSHDYMTMYIRRGDKSVEMRLPPLAAYTHSLSLLHERNLVSTATEPRLLFLASEDSKVIKSMREWNDHHKKYEIIATEIFDRAGLLAERTADERKKMSPTQHDHHPLEYLSMMLNVHYLVKGTSYICTLSSNFCRIIDELRATVGGKADRPYVDLSVETCSNPPCIYDHVFFLDWR
jgi:hypothetical protein